MVNENIKAKTQDHIWQLGEGLIPHLKGLSYSKNLSEEERNELAERYQNAFNKKSKVDPMSGTFYRLTILFIST